LAIGGCTIEELKSRMTAREKESWRLFLRVYGPVGFERQDWQTAQIVQANCGSGESVSEYLLKFETGGKKNKRNGLVKNSTRLAGIGRVNS